jgi:uncharacterized protein YcaQ
MRRDRKPRDSIAIGEARRIALGAQGLATPGDPDRAGSSRPGREEILRTARRLGVVQIDSVNVLVRSHFLPFYSRLGPYDPAVLEAAAYQGRRRGLFEYWGHEASLLPVELQPLLRWRMQQAARGDGLWSGIARFGRGQRAFCADVLAQIRERGPLGVSELAAGGRRKGGWWGWSDGKVALEWLFWTGQVTTFARRHFERVYDVPERVLPARVLAAATPTEADAQRELLRRSLSAMGIATARDLRDYFRLPLAASRTRVAELVEAGEWRIVQVEGWRDPAYAPATLRVPARAEARALLSPFDSLVWCRERTERLFDFRYRLEIYTPAHRRVHGYYVLPFLLGDRLAARVDLKADRAAGRLRVPAVHFEANAGLDPRSIAAELDPELDRLAAWLGLQRDTRDALRLRARRRA